MSAIRPAVLSDSDALFFLASAFATSFSVERSAFDSSFAALLQSPEAFVGVASDTGTVIGYVLGFDHHTFYANGRVAWVEEIMVSEEMRGHGIGRQLMNCFEQWAKTRQSRLVALATRKTPEPEFQVWKRNLKIPLEERFCTGLGLQSPSFIPRTSCITGGAPS